MASAGSQCYGVEGKLYGGRWLALDKEARNNQTYFGKANRLILFHRLPIGLFRETFEGEIGDCGRLK